MTDYIIFDLIEQLGGRVVLDGTEGGERTMPARFDPERVREDPLGELVRAYFDTIPDEAGLATVPAEHRPSGLGS